MKELEKRLSEQPVPDEPRLVERLEEQVRTKQMLVEELVQSKDFTAAAVAQAEVTELEKCLSELSVLDERIRLITLNMDALKAKKDFNGAAAAQAQLCELKKRVDAISSVVPAQSPAPGGDVGADAKSPRLVEPLKEELRTKQTLVQELAKSKDFTAAAVAQAEVTELEKRLSELVSAHVSSSVSGPPSTPQGCGSSSQRSAGLRKKLESLPNLRVLSSSKILKVTARNQMKGNGKKGGGKKGKGKKGFEPAKEDCATLYVGCIRTQQIYTVQASGEFVDKVRAYVNPNRQPLVNVKNVERRPGKEELFCTDETVITTCVEPTGGGSAARFAYDVSEVTKHLATKAYATQAGLGSFVDLVIRIDAADELPIQSGPNQGETYLQVSGVDMDGDQVGPLRLWEHTESDVEAGSIYIFRGMKIASERTWDDASWKWTNHSQGLKTLDCDIRTAIEDVSDQPDITSYFR